MMIFEILPREGDARRKEGAPPKIPTSDFHKKHLPTTLINKMWINPQANQPKGLFSCNLKVSL